MTQTVKTSKSVSINQQQVYSAVSDHSHPSLWRSLLYASRPRTYPLAAASIVAGNGLAYLSLPQDTGMAWTGKQWLVFVLSLWVALALQILSNLANDYGDGIKGTDNERDAASPQRLTSQGYFNPARFRQLIYAWAGFTFACGVGLIYVGFDSLRDFLLFLAFGIIAIIAACAYTMGKRPYGYRAMGEVAVLVFFGWLGVLGSAYLQTQTLVWAHVLPATGCGLLAAAVLYLNNMRDLHTDATSGKVTLTVLLGQDKMVYGYFVILAAALALYFIFAICHQPTSLLWLLWLPIILKHGYFIHQHRNQPPQIGGQLKTIVISTLLINILFVMGMFANILI